MGDPQLLEDEIASLRDQRQRLNSEISDLPSVIQYNEERLDEVDYDVIRRSKTRPRCSDGAVTEQLLEGEDEESVVCWTCGRRLTASRSKTPSTACRTSAGRRRGLNDIKSQLDDLKTDRARPKRSSAVARTSSGRSRRRKRDRRRDEQITSLGPTRGTDGGRRVAGRRGRRSNPRTSTPSLAAPATPTSTV